MSSEVSLVDAAQAAAILGARWENDPLRLWKPTQRQTPFLETNAIESAMLGANRSGKSDALAAKVASYLRFGNPNPGTAYSMGGRLAITDRAVSVWCVGLTEKLVKEGIQPKLVTTAYTTSETHPAFIPPSEIDNWNINDQTWRLKNGSILAFKSADAGRDVFQSAGRDMVAFDEICEWEVFKEATFRTPGGMRRLLICLAATLLPPVGVVGGVSWYYPQKIKPWMAAGNVPNRGEGNPSKNLAIFTMGIRHNPYIHPEEIQRLEEMFPPGSLEARIRLDGELLPSIGGALAYSAFDYNIHVDKRLSPANIDFRIPLVLTVDFNVVPGVWEIGQRVGNEWRWLDEIMFERADVPAMTEEFRRRYPSHGAKLFIRGDQTGKIRSPQSGQTNYFVMQEVLQGYPVPIEIQLPTKNPPVTDRLNAVNRLLSGSDGHVRMVFSPECVEAIKDCEEVLRDERGGIKKSHHPESPYYLRTHAMDAIGYAVTYSDPVPQSAVSESRLRHVPQPRYTGRARSTSFGQYPSSYDADGRLRRGPSGGILPPRNPRNTYPGR